MKTKACTAVFAVILLAASTVRADVIPGRWELVDALEPGTPVTIKLKAGDRMECVFKESSPLEVTFAGERGNEGKVLKSEILRIEMGERTADGLANGALIGMGLGAAGAIGALYAYADSVTASGPIWGGDSAGYFIAAGLVGAGMGALAGLAVDASAKKNKVIYQAR
jgi:hypothetical protein